VRADLASAKRAQPSQQRRLSSMRRQRPDRAAKRSLKTSSATPASANPRHRKPEQRPKVCLKKLPERSLIPAYQPSDKKPIRMFGHDSAIHRVRGGRDRKPVVGSSATEAEVSTVDLVEPLQKTRTFRYFGESDALVHLIKKMLVLSRENEQGKESLCDTRCSFTSM
jgi:hypothetical protein